MSDLKDPRVLFAAERTLLAWNRTSLALIAFGFVVERAHIVIPAIAPKVASAKTAAIMFWVGFGFIALGVFAAVYSSRQYLAVLKTLSPAEFPAGYHSKWGISVNLIMAALGVVLGTALYIGSR